MIRLGTTPTPLLQISRVSTPARFWVKRDDLVAPLYGGNKVRKLEHLLGDATRAGKSRIVTIGAAGSHQVVATALYGRQEGFTVDAVLVPQPASEHGRENLRVAIALGLRPVVASSWAMAPARVAMQLGSDAYLIPLGGSNALGSLGFVDAAKEIAAQVEAKLMPEPDVVVVAMGSGGTAAGLAVGFEALDMKTRVVGVAVSPPVALLAAMARHVARTTAALAGLSKAKAACAVKRIDVDKKWVGRGYGYSTRDGDAATVIAAQNGIALDATYTAKAFACALDRACTNANTNTNTNTEETILYWHTLSAAPLDALLANAPALPSDVDALFRDELVV